MSLAACGGSRSKSPGQSSVTSSSALRAPAWFSTPRQNDTRYRYFVGSAYGQPDEGTARELAVQKALYELSVFCGATLNAESFTFEAERNGEQTQEVSVSVSVAGEEISIQEASTHRWKIGRNDDGRYDAYVEIKWPNAQYDKVRAAQRDRANRALALFLEAQQAADEYEVSKATRLLRECKPLLAGAQALIPVDHPKYRNSGLVYEAVEALSARVTKMRAERSGRMAVAVLCIENGRANDCESRWVGTVRSQVTQGAFEVAADPVPTGVAEAILDSRSPRADRALRASGYVLAVKYRVRESGREDGFVFARCGARGVIFDTDKKKNLHVREVKPKKGGHVNLPGAVNKACEKAEREMMAWIDRSIGAVKGTR